ncbi:MAG TPA: ABC-2 family transporter protein [Anaerolineae bacterium]|nr:ABC-2 family transporter protein [Anaerolineae bacterium]
MRNLALAYRVLVGAAWAKTIEYRAQIVIWLVSWLFPLIMMVVWLAVVDEVGPAAGWEKDDFVSYYVAAAVVMYLTVAWLDWDEDIRTGELSAKLLKPLDPFHHYLTEDLGWKLFLLVFVVPIVAVVVWLVPAIHYPLTLGRLAATAGAIVLGYAVNMMMSSTFAMIAFWSTQANNLFQLWIGAGQFLSGWIAPLALFPAGFRQVAYVLPFRATMSLPLEILMGRLTWPETAAGLGIACAWTLFFFVVYRLLWRAGVRRYEAVGA